MQSANPHIFYADDDVDDLELFRGALVEVDDSLVLTAVDNGNALLERLSCPPPVPRLIFLDLNMPELDGYSVLRALRGDRRLKDYPVVIFSTASDPVAVSRTRELGANLFVPKPHTYAGMKQAIKTCIEIDWCSFQPSDTSFFVRFN
jgi:CheY-like chemotaxis protein